jgi:putative sterol carrier protein
MPSTREIFDQLIPAALAKHASQARELHAILCIKVTGEGGGVWTVDLEADPPSCTPNDSGHAQCTIALANDDFLALLENHQLGIQLFFQGKLKVEGDPMLATRIAKLLSLAQQ